MVPENELMTFEVAVGFLANEGIIVMVDESLPPVKQEELKAMVVNMVERQVWEIIAETPQDEAESLLEDALLIPLIRERIADPRSSVSLDVLAAELGIELDT